MKFPKLPTTIGALLCVATLGLATAWTEQKQAEPKRVMTHGEATPTAATGEPVHLPDGKTMFLGPLQMWRFYGIDKIPGNTWGAGQTIALLSQAHNPYLESDLAVFDERFGLTPCTVKNHCLVFLPTENVADDGSWEATPALKPENPTPPPIPADGKTPVPASGETMMDVEWAHAIAPYANIMVIELPVYSWVNVLHAVDKAVAVGATVISMSYAEPQKAEHFGYYQRGDRHFLSDKASYLASAGDHGHTARWPASSPDVVGVGGTTIRTDENGTVIFEHAWNTRPAGDRFVGDGGGLSGAETEPPYQIAYGIPNDEKKMRGTPDVSYFASSLTPIAVYNTAPSKRKEEDGAKPTAWRGGGGTSAGAPAWAGLLAIANSMRAKQHKVPLSKYVGQGEDAAFGKGTLAALYTVGKHHPEAYRDITEGKNGDCGAECQAGPGYDYLTGLGSPQADVLIPDLVALP
jgi:subtilase family serine protease